MFNKYGWIMIISIVLGLGIIVVIGRQCVYTGYCRPCFNQGVKRKIYRLGIPKKWECFRH
jgi:hypothetical protein